METKVSRRNVSVIEIRKDSEFLGYYTGQDREFKVHYSPKLEDAIVAKTAKYSEHRLFHLNKYHGDEFSFKKVDCIEIFTTTYYDEYDEVDPKKVDAYYVLKIKRKDDMLSEPCYLSMYDKKEISFESSLNIEKAILTGEHRSTILLYHLSRKYADKYEFYVDRLFIRKTRELQTID